MGFIKAIAGASKQFGETYREVIQCDNSDSSNLVRMVTTESGMIQDQSRLYVQPGQCAIYIDQGAIKDIITEPGMYFMDTSAPSLFQNNIFKGFGATTLESIKRISYEGSVISKQKVYFIDITEKLGLKYGSLAPIIYKDPTWGPIEIKLFGEYTLQVVNPVNLLVNVCGPKANLEIEDIALQIRSFILSALATSVGNLNVSFDMIAANQGRIAENIIKELNNNFKNYGVEVIKLVISAVEVDEEIKAAMRERTGIKMKATSVDANEADIYAKLSTAEAVKEMARNNANAGSTIMGMNVGNTMAGLVKGNITGFDSSMSNETPKSILAENQIINPDLELNETSPNSETQSDKNDNEY